jgi:hypothetical protein
MADALFEVVDEDREAGTGTFQPTELSRGPWSPDALHGGPVGALVARQLEAVPAALPLHPSRLTVELLYPVPLEPLTVRTYAVRRGKRVRVLGADVHGPDDTLLVRATLQQVRRQPITLPAFLRSTTGATHAPPDRGDAEVGAPDWNHTDIAFHSHATEHHVVAGGWTELGPTTDWIRLTVPVVAGEAPSPLQRVAAAADFGNGISAALPYGEWLFINPDLTIHLHRLPEGEWVCLDAATWIDGDGVGQAESELYDERGRLGRSLQSLLIEPAS